MVSGRWQMVADGGVDVVHLFHRGTIEIRTQGFAFAVLVFSPFLFL